MRKTFYLFLIGAIFALSAAPTYAQSSGSVIVEKHGDTTTTTEFKPAGTATLNTQMFEDFASVKRDDSKVASPLAGNPSLVENQEFVQKHPSLKAFLDKYPDARKKLEENPGNFLPLPLGAKSASHEASGIPRDE